MRTIAFTTIAIMLTLLMPGLDPVAQPTPETEEPAVQENPCEDSLSDAILAVHVDTDPAYANLIAERICYWSECRAQDPYDIAAIISTETRFVPQTRCGRFGCGAMQVIGAHARRHGLPRNALLILDTNIRIGTEVYEMSGRDFGNYNGHATPGYAQATNRWRRELIDATSN